MPKGVKLIQDRPNPHPHQHVVPARIMRQHLRMHREQDFDHFM